MAPGDFIIDCCRFGPLRRPLCRGSATTFVEEYGGEEDDEYSSWVLLEPTAGGEVAEVDAPEVPEAAGSAYM